MSYFPAYETKTIAELPLGTIFAFGRGGQTFIGLTIAARNGATPAIAVLHPGHPSLGGVPGLLDGSVLGKQSLLVIPDAKFVLPSEPENIKVGFNQMEKPPGALFLEKDRLGVAIYANPNAMGSPISVYDVDSGERIQSDFYDSVWFSSWEIKAPDLNGNWTTVCRCGAKEIAS